ncbi:MAG: tetratricopeptide repeat protein [Magnetococcales bacterium]|nr:tetratricopeptide repeat protein [Magnetococcales bacterium]
MAARFIPTLLGLILIDILFLSGSFPDGSGRVWAADRAVAEKGSEALKKGVDAQKKGHFVVAETLYTNALAGKDLDRATEAETLANRCLVRLELGQRNKDKEKFIAGFDDCNRAALLKPDLAHAYLFRGNGYLAVEQFDLAAEDFKVAMGLAPRDPLPFYLRARALLRLGRRAEAKQNLDNVLKIQPKFSPAHVERGLIHLQQANLTQALKDFTEAIRLNPEWHEAYFLRSELLGRMGKIKEALADVERVLRGRPDHPVAMFRRGLFHLALGETDAAIAAFEQARRLAPADPQVPAGLGMARLGQGSLAAAEADFALSLQLAPHDPFVLLWSALTRLKGNPQASLPALTGSETDRLEHWPNPLRALLLGALTPDAVLQYAGKVEKAGKPMAMAETHFFMAQYHLLHGQASEAEKSFRQYMALPEKDPLLTYLVTRERDRFATPVAGAVDDKPKTDAVTLSPEPAVVAAETTPIMPWILSATPLLPSPLFLRKEDGSPADVAPEPLPPAETVEPATSATQNKQHEKPVSQEKVEPATPATQDKQHEKPVSQETGWPFGEVKGAVTILVTNSKSTDLSDIVKYFRRNGLVKSGQRMHLLRTRGNRTLVYLGTFTHVAEARKHIEGMTPFLKKNNPTILPLSRVEMLLKTAQVFSIPGDPG